MIGKNYSTSGINVFISGAKGLSVMKPLESNELSQIQWFLRVRPDLNGNILIRKPVCSGQLFWRRKVCKMTKCTEMSYSKPGIALPNAKMPFWFQDVIWTKEFPASPGRFDGCKLFGWKQLLIQKLFCESGAGSWLIGYTSFPDALYPGQRCRERCRGYARGKTR